MDEQNEYYKNIEQENFELIDAILFVVKPAFWILVGYVLCRVTL